MKRRESKENSEGDISLDLTGKMAGRGAYVCPDKECITKAYKGHRLENRYQTGISGGRR